MATAPWLLAAAMILMPTGAPTAQPKDSARKVEFTPVRFDELPGWSRDDHVAALKTFLKSCERVKALAERGAPAGRAVPAPGLLLACSEAAALPTRKLVPVEARSFFEHFFEPHRVRHGQTQGLLTGYYEPVLEGSRVPTERFKTPVYRRPPDLVDVIDETMRGAAAGRLTHLRRVGDRLEPYPTRADIEQGALSGMGLELVYLADPVDAFFMHVQGSGRIKLTDGTSIRIGYDGKNGHPYTSIGRYLIDQGLLDADKISLASLAKWLRAEPERGRRVMWQNASFVFFRELDKNAGAPKGALGVPLTPGRSLAVDASVHVLGSPIFVSSPTLTHAESGGPFARLMIAQDVGSAIKGPERGDIYFGSGAAAGRLAGITRHPGNFFALLPRDPGTGAATP
ncbi:MAG TPA: MltA domain-containing protein [Hyphomicrobiaceae bacterium]|nr:MltA domain-containing protein [Hyphomicrobiaceae bacterium]